MISLTSTARTPSSVSVQAKSMRVFCRSGSISSRMTFSGACSPTITCRSSSKYVPSSNPEKYGCQSRRHGGKRLAHTPQQIRLERVQARKALQLDEARRQPSALRRIGADAEIHLQKQRVRRFARDLQPRRNRRLRVPRELRRAQLGNDFPCRPGNLRRELRRQKDRRF